MKFVKYLPLLLLCLLTACGDEPSKETMLAEVKSIKYMGDDPLMRSVTISAQSRLSSTIILLKDGRDVDRKELNDALIFATLFDAETVVKFLIEKGADVNAVGVEQFASLLGGFTPLHMAAIRNNTKLAKLLIDHGADVNSGSIYGVSALSLAERYNNTEVAEFLRAQGAIEPLPSEL